MQCGVGKKNSIERLGIAEGRDLEAKTFNFAQVPNRSTND